MTTGTLDVLTPDTVAQLLILAYAPGVAALIGRCTRAIVTARGVLIRTENEYYRKAQEAAGPQWTQRHRECFGLGSSVTMGLDAFEQGIAACRLYAETAQALDDILDGPARDVVRRALAVIA